MLLVTGAYFPEFSSGGLQSRAVAQALRERAEFKVLTTTTDRTLRTDDCVDAVPVTRVHVRARSRASRWRAIGALAARLWRLLWRADLVHVQGYSTKNIVVSMVAKLVGRPVIVHLQTSLHDEPPAIRAQGPLAWWAFRSADAYISVSEGLKRAYLDAGLRADRVRVIPNGVDMARFFPATQEQREQLRQELGLSPTLPMVLFVGVISPDKQPHVLLAAWAALQSEAATRSRLIFVGATDPALYELEGRLIDRLRATVREQNATEHVFFVEPTIRIEDYYRAADVLVMPSLREGLPNVVLEAMACGLPVVASRLPGSTDTMIENDVNGLLVPVGDAPGFAAAIDRVLRDGGLAARLGGAARRTAETRYDIRMVAERWLDVYRELLGRR